MNTFDDKAMMAKEVLRDMDGAKQALGWIAEKIPVKVSLNITKQDCAGEWFVSLPIEPEVLAKLLTGYADKKKVEYQKRIKELGDLTEE